MYQEMYSVICVDNGDQLQIYRVTEEFVKEVFRQSSVGGESQVKSRKGKVPEKQMCQNCMPTINVNTLCMHHFCGYLNCEI